jgi:uncharacterized membrane protein
MTILTLLHIASGALAVLAGALAIGVRKGGRIHVRAGRWFVRLMVLSSLSGAVIGLIRFEDFFITFFAGLLGAYLVLSGWLTAKSPAGPAKRAELGMSIVNAMTFLSLTGLGVLALNRADGAMFGFAGENYLFLAGMSGIALIGDISRVFRGSISRKHQIARHLWRMLLGFFIAAGSAFTGPGASAFPEAVQASGILALPELLILLAMLFYLIKTLAISPKPKPQ